jgi:hypothetical protein
MPAARQVVCFVPPVRAACPQLSCCRPPPCGARRAALRARLLRSAAELSSGAGGRLFYDTHKRTQVRYSNLA